MGTAAQAAAAATAAVSAASVTFSSSRLLRKVWLRSPATSVPAGVPLVIALRPMTVRRARSTIVSLSSPTNVVESCVV